MVTHGHHLGNDGFAGPLDSKDLRQLLEVVGGRLTDGEDGVTEPLHAQVAQLLIKEADTKLAGEQGNVFNNGQANAPLLVLGESDDGRKQRL